MESESGKARGGSTSIRGEGVFEAQASGARSPWDKGEGGRGGRRGEGKDGTKGREIGLTGSMPRRMNESWKYNLNLVKSGKARGGRSTTAAPGRGEYSKGRQVGPEALETIGGGRRGEGRGKD